MGGSWSATRSAIVWWPCTTTSCRRARGSRCASTSPIAGRSARTNRRLPGFHPRPPEASRRRPPGPARSAAHPDPDPRRWRTGLRKASATPTPPESALWRGSPRSRRCRGGRGRLRGAAGGDFGWGVSNWSTLSSLPRADRRVPLPRAPRSPRTSPSGGIRSIRGRGRALISRGFDLDRDARSARESGGDPPLVPRRCIVLQCEAQ